MAAGRWGQGAMSEAYDRIVINRVAILVTCIFLISFGLFIYFTDGKMLLRPISSIYKGLKSEPAESFCQKKQNKATRRCTDLQADKRQNWDDISRSKGSTTAFSLHSK